MKRLVVQFNQHAEARKELSQTVKLSGMKSDDFDTIYYVGGHGPKWDLVDNPDSIALIESFGKASDWAPFALVDGRVLTGLNAASSTVAATAAIDLLAVRKAA